MPLSELRARQRLVLERLREKMRLQVQLAGPEADADEEQFRKKLDEGLEQALEPIREKVNYFFIFLFFSNFKDQLVHQLRTQITDLERYVHLLQREVLEATGSPTPGSPSKKPLAPECSEIPGDFAPRQMMASLPAYQNGAERNSDGWIIRLFGCGSARK